MAIAEEAFCCYIIVVYPALDKFECKNSRCACSLSNTSRTAPEVAELDICGS